MPFPWDEAMAFGLGRLRLSPDAFWGMTLPELARAAEGFSGVASARPMTRAEMEALMLVCPD